MATPQLHEVQAVARWVRMSPRKARLVAEHIRGRTVPEARTVLASGTLRPRIVSATRRALRGETRTNFAVASTVRGVSTAAI